MDESVADEVTAPMDAVHTTPIQSKESEYSLKPGSSGIVHTQEMVIPGDDDRESSPRLFVDLLDGGNLDRIGSSEHACSSPRCVNDAGVMVEELTVRDYNSENLAIVGTSSNRERMQTRENRWQHLYQLAGGSECWGSGRDGAYRGNDQNSVSSVLEGVGYSIFPEHLGQTRGKENHCELTENMQTDENRPVPSNKLLSPEGIRTKILSKSGFSEYFVKNTLKGKGVICRGPACEKSNVNFRNQTCANGAGVIVVDSGAQLSLISEAVRPPSCDTTDPRSHLCPDAFHDGFTLREWLKAGHNKVDKVKSLHIFRQIVNLVDFSHSQGVPLQDLRPSFFKLLPSNRVVYLGSNQKEVIENVRNQDIYHSKDYQNEKRPLELGVFPIVNQGVKKQKFRGNMNHVKRWPQFPLRSGIKSSTANCTNVFSGPKNHLNEFNDAHNPKIGHQTQRKSSSALMTSTSQLLLTSIHDPLEEKWYTSPEELRERSFTFASNIYCLGVLLFELLGSFDSERARVVAMSDLRERILPPNFLSENPKEAGFCLWLLHPEPSSRPSTREILQFEVVGIQELCGDEMSSSINQEDAESELLLHFLVSLKEQKQKDASILVDEIRCLEADIEEVERRQAKKSLLISSFDKSINAARSKLLYGEHSSLEMKSKISSVSNNDPRLMKNIGQLESAYFSMRSKVQLSDNDVTMSAKNELLKSREEWNLAWKNVEKLKPTDDLGVFFDGVCKYARYSKFEVKGILRNGDFNNSASVICSLSFDRDEDYFATAGVSKKIKIYDFHALSDDSVNIHYPVIEMPNKSKLSCICWNSYIRNYLASTDYEGVVKLWDVGTGQSFSQYIEHEKRAWSVDFSHVDPAKLASGSDDCSVKLWSINEKRSLCTIRNIANICCVQFSADSPHLLAFGSADYKTYCYDLRNVSNPWCILAGHDKAVSYVKFVDSGTIVSASTDNTLKLWDLNKASSGGLSTDACILTLKGHMNEKNFVGLSVAHGYIACGSETNEVFAYYKTLPMPITSHKFGSIDPVSGKETDDDNGQFVSSVCWRQKSEMVVAANSSGSIKLLQMV